MAPNPLAVDVDHILSHTRGWDELRGGRLFLTGGTGFVGCWLLESFTAANERLRLGAEAVILTRNPDAFRRRVPHLAGHPAVRLVSGDVRGFRFPDGPFTHVIHAATAAATDLHELRPLALLDTIAEGTREVLEFARSKRVRSFLLTSSGTVYGRQPPDFSHVPEDYPGGPDPLDHHSAYGEGKRTAELLCALYAHQHGLEPKVARCWSFVGPYLPLDGPFAASHFLRDALAGRDVQVGGDGTPYRSYLYAADLAVWLWTVLFQAPPCRAYNVGSDEEVTLAELAHLVATEVSPAVGVRIAREAVPGKTAERYVPSIDRARKELGLAVRIGLREAVARTLNWHRRPTEVRCAA